MQAAGVEAGDFVAIALPNGSAFLGVAYLSCKNCRPECCVITLKDGLIQRIEEYLDPAQAAVPREAKAS